MILYCSSALKIKLWQGRRNREGNRPPHPPPLVFDRTVAKPWFGKSFNYCFLLPISDGSAQAGPAIDSGVFSTALLGYIISFASKVVQ